MGNRIQKETKASIGLGNVDNTSDATKLEAHQDNLGGTVGGDGDGFLKTGNEHLSIIYNDTTPSLTFTVYHTLCFDPVGIEFGNTTQEYDVDGVTWVAAVAGGTLGGIPDETSGGHELAPCLAAIASAIDGSYLAVREGTGAATATNPATVQFLFEDVVAFDHINLRMMYNGSPTHVVGIEFWNYTTSAWVRTTTIASGASYVEISKKVFGSENFVGTGGDVGDVMLQIIHDTAGINTHRYEFDLVSICDGG